jgi:hypothetical protein
VALHASDLLTPKGRINAVALWPGVDPDEAAEYVEEYLAQGYAQAPSNDEAARQWAYYRAWDEKYQILSAMPASVSTSDEGSSGYTQSQIDSWRTLSLEALAVYEEEASSGTDAGAYGVITSLR